MKRLDSIAVSIALALASATSPVFAGETSPATTSAGPSVETKAGRMLFDSTGSAVGAIYRITAQGDPQLIVHGRFVTVPSTTITMVNGKLTTSRTRTELGWSR